MMITRKALHRLTFVRGLGVALGLAWFAGALLLISLPVELLGWLFGVRD